eukprot:11192254-Lingulodinium_polyedra.AAC.1
MHRPRSSRTRAGSPVRDQVPSPRTRETGNLSSAASTSGWTARAITATHRCVVMDKPAACPAARRK